jgi:HAE1 family hydrophobic/amphiphilic exporter-1
MIGVTIFGLLFTPSFYIISRNAGDTVARWTRRRPARVEPSVPEPEVAE